MFNMQDQLVSLALVNGDEIFGYNATFKMPVLEELFLLAQVSSHGINDEQAIVKFDAPKLHRVFLYNSEVGLSIVNPSLPYHQISHLSLGSPCTLPDGESVNADNFFDLFTQLSSLMSLHLSRFSLQSDDSDQEPSIEPQSVITHQHLKYLELYDPSLELLAPFGGSDCALLPRISTPSLEIFDLCFVVPKNHLGRTLQDSLVPFFQRAPSLQQIRLVIMSKWYIPGCPTSSPAEFFQFTGGSAFFGLLSRIITDDVGDNSFVEQSKRKGVPKGDWLAQEELWTDKLIDRYFDHSPVIAGPTEEDLNSGGTFEDDNPAVGDEGYGRSRRSVKEVENSPRYKAQDRRTIKAVFEMLADSRIPAHVQRHVYLAF